MYFGLTCLLVACVIVFRGLIRSNDTPQEKAQHMHRPISLLEGNAHFIPLVESRLVIDVCPLSLLFQFNTAVYITNQVVTECSGQTMVRKDTFPTSRFHPLITKRRESTDSIFLLRMIERVLRDRLTCSFLSLCSIVIG